MAIVRPIPYQIDLNTRIRTNPRIVATVGDKDSLTLQVSLTVNGNEFDLTGWKVYFKALLPNQENFILDDSIVIKDTVAGSFEYTFNTAAFSVPGQIKDAMFMLTKGSTPDQIAHSFYFTYEVKSDPTVGYLQAESFVSDYERFKDELKDLMQDSFDNANAALANSQHAIEEVEAAEGRIDELEEQIQNAQIVKKSDTTNWQKFPNTDANGMPLVNNLTDWNNILSLNMTRTAIDTNLASLNAPPNSGGRYYDVDIYRRTKTTGHIVATEMVQGKQFFRVIAGRAGAEAWRDWVELETTSGSAQKVEDLKTTLLNLLPTAETTGAKLLINAADDFNALVTNQAKTNNFFTFYLNAAATNGTGRATRGIVVGTSSTNFVILAVDASGNFYSQGVDGGKFSGWKTYGKTVLWTGVAKKSSPTQRLTASLSNYRDVEIVAAAGEGNSPSVYTYKNNGSQGYVVKGTNIADSGTNSTLWGYEARVFFDNINFNTFTIDIDNRVTVSSGSNAIDTGDFTTVYEIRGVNY